ncbi:hypothetical protein [Rhodococcus sp. G-MC3]|uniref:hypothetical protein n=1 Tax=Rhodococcus sp. G-MC3 TaxID=3046209 RepID=UPI0024BB27CA|nr:hypothetical protein [Rhodococcus sp. G-MC3]
MIAVTLIASTFAVNETKSWEFGSICSRWNDVGPCRSETAFTLTTLFALLLPLGFGIFVGAPTFGRDIEQRTHVVGLTQSTSRARWYLTRVTVVFVPISLAMVGLGMALRLASTVGPNSRDYRADDPMHSIQFSLFDFPHFETTGFALGGYTLLTLLVASTAAILFRHVILAMLATFFVFLAVPVVLTLVVRDDYAEPVALAEPIDGLSRSSSYPPNPYYTDDGTWVVKAGYVDAAGSRMKADFDSCATEPSDRTQREGEDDELYKSRLQAEYAAESDAFDNCIRAQGIDRFEIEYHAESSYWRFQATETGLMLLVSGAVALLGYWGVRRLTPQ